jgi:hypothetical protein
LQSFCNFLLTYAGRLGLAGCEIGPFSGNHSRHIEKEISNREVYSFRIRTSDSKTTGLAIPIDNQGIQYDDVQNSSLVSYKGAGNCIPVSKCGQSVNFTA